MCGWVRPSSTRKRPTRDVPKLLATPAAVRFVSYEPALGPVDWTAFKGLDWIIVGGESTQGAPARPFDQEWALATIIHCRVIGAAPFVKQLGSRQGLKDRAGADPAEWPADLRVREFPGELLPQGIDVGTAVRVSVAGVHGPHPV